MLYFVRVYHSCRRIYVFDPELISSNRLQANAATGVENSVKKRKFKSGLVRHFTISVHMELMTCKEKFLR